MIARNTPEPEVPTRVVLPGLSGRPLGEVRIVDGRVVACVYDQETGNAVAMIQLKPTSDVTCMLTDRDGKRRLACSRDSVGCLVSDYDAQDKPRPLIVIKPDCTRIVVEE